MSGERQELSGLAIELAQQLDVYGRSRAPFSKDFHPATVSLLGFIVARNPPATPPKISDSWPVDRSSLNNAVKAFHQETSHLGRCEEFRRWERAIAEGNPNIRIPARPLGFPRGGGKELFFPVNFSTDIGAMVTRTAGPRSACHSRPSTPPAEVPNLDEDQSAPHLEGGVDEEVASSTHPNGSSGVSTDGFRLTAPRPPRFRNASLPSSIPFALQEGSMDPAQETTFSAAQESRLQILIAEAVAAALRASAPRSEPPPGPPGPPGPAGPPGPQGPQGISSAPASIAMSSAASTSSTTWKTEDLGYFHPDLPDRDESAVRTVSNQTHYRDVLVFLDRLRDLVTLKGEDVVRANIHASLRGSALAWYTSELSEFERQSVRHMPLEHGWFHMLRQRFKLRPSQALAKLTETTFSFADVRLGKSVRQFAQMIFRYSQAAEITSTFNQVTQAWSKLSPQLRRDVPEPTPATTVTEFLGILEAKEIIWKDIAAQPRYSQRRPQYDYDREPRQDNYQGPPLTRPPTRQNQGYYPGYRRPSYSNQRYGRQGYDRTQWNAPGYGRTQWVPWSNQRPNPSQHSTQANSEPRDGGPRAQLLLTDKPRKQASRGDAQRQPWNRQPNVPWNRDNGARWNRESSIDKPSAYKTEIQQAEFPPNEPSCNATQDNGVLAASEAYADFQPDYPDEYGYLEESIETYNSLARQDDWLEDDQDLYEGQQGEVSCWHCHQNFLSNNKLHAHIPDCIDFTQPTAFHVETSDEIIQSTRTAENKPGYRFSPWRYVSAQVFLLFNKENPLIICLDTGCSMTIIDDAFATELGLIRRKTEPIPVKGIAAALISTEYVVFDVFFPGYNPRKIEAPSVTGKITIEAHIVPRLESKLLVGIDVLAPEGITMDLTRRVATITSCDNMEFPITLKAKPHHRPPRPVCAAFETVIPPRAQAQISTSLRGGLEKDRDYIFEPCRQKPAFFAQAVDGNFAFVHAINRTNEPIVVRRKDRIGYISEFDFTEAFQVGTDAAELASSDTRHPNDARPAILPDSTGRETVTPEGITIHGDGENARRFRQIAESYDIWRDTGPARIPEELYMHIPLKEGWENSKMKHKVYPLSKEGEKLVDETFDKLHDQDRMDWATGHTPSGYPVFVAYRTIPKPDGTTIKKGRVVVDLRGLNKRVELDVYPLPLQEEIIAMVAGCAYITIVDAISFFYQWRIREDHQNRVAVVSHRGQEIFKVAIMGYCNSVAYVQRIIDLILREYREFCRVYVDDVLIASKDAAAHEEHLRLVFGKLEEHNIALSPAKSYIGFPSIKLLGYKVDALGLATPDEKVKAVASLRFPETLKELETYLGMTGALRQFVKGYAWKAEALQRRKTLLLKAAPREGNARRSFASKEPLKQPSEAELASFEAIQAELSSPRFLHHHDRTKQLYVDIDASKERGIGAMAYHIQDDRTHTDHSKPPGQMMVLPVLFLSRRLTPAEINYWPTELEVAGVVWAIRKIRHMIEASPAEKPCVIYTDHSATAEIARQSSLVSTSTDRLNLRHVRASQYIQQFPLRIFHRPGKSNAIADALSRLPTEDEESENPTKGPHQGEFDRLEETYAWNVSLTELSSEFRSEVMKGYNEDSRWSLIIEALQKDERSKDPIKTVLPYILRDGLLYSRDVSGEERLCIPRSIVPQVFKLAHDEAGHQGFDRTYDRLKGLTIYKCTKLLKQYIYHCGQCREYARKRHKPYGSLQPILTPPIPFYCITIDFVLALPITTDGYDAALAVVDKFSKRTGFTAGKTTWNAEEWGRALIRHLQIADWGFPRMIISDRDRKFLSKFWQGMFQALNAKLLYSTAYHAQTDGQTERMIGVAEVLIRHFIALYPEENWKERLPALQEILNSSQSNSTGHTPHELMYGIQLHNPLNIGFKTPECQDFTVREDAAEALRYASMYMKRYYDRKHQPQHYTVGDSVYIRLHKGYHIPDKGISNKWLQQDAGPFKVIERVGKLAYRLELPSHMKIHNVISVAHLEPAPIGEDPFARPYQPNPPPVAEDADGADYELDAILNKRTIRRGRKTIQQYLIRWKGYGAQWNEWYDEAKLPNARELIAEFEESQANLPSRK